MFESVGMYLYLLGSTLLWCYLTSGNVTVIFMYHVLVVYTVTPCLSESLLAKCMVSLFYTILSNLVMFCCFSQKGANTYNYL